MACDKKTCKVCNQIGRFRAFKRLLPISAQATFEQWFTEIYTELEEATTSKIEWRQDKPRYKDETELQYQLRLLEWKENQNEH